MKNTSKRILVSVLTLILAVVAIGTTTFAWFTLGNVGTVGGIEGTVVGGEGLQIKLVTRNSGEPGVSGEDNIIKQTDFLNHIVFDNTFLQNDFKFAGSEYAELDQLKAMYKMGAKSNGHLYRGVESEINKDYVELEFTFRSLQENADIHITLVDTESTGKKNVKAGTSFLGMKGAGMISDGEDFADDQMINKNDKYSVVGKHALRLGLVEFDNQLEDGMKVYYDGHNESNDSGQKAYLASTGTKIFESNSSLQESAAVDYKTILTDNGEQRLFPGEYLKIDNQGDLVPVAPGVLAESILVSKLDTQEDPNANEDDFKYYTGTATIRIWLDGWDPHAFDAIFNQMLKVELQFEIK